MYTSFDYEIQSDEFAMEYEEWLALQEEFYSPDFEDMEKSLNS
jgi:hypothetical protein